MSHPDPLRAEPRASRAEAESRGLSDPAGRSPDEPEGEKGALMQTRRVCMRPSRAKARQHTRVRTRAAPGPEAGEGACRPLQSPKKAARHGASSATPAGGCTPGTPARRAMLRDGPL